MDQISNFLISIKNASMANKPYATVPYSKMKSEIADVLVKTGFIASSSKKGKKAKVLEIGLIYKNNSPRISGVQRVSKPSRRLYGKAKEIFPFKQGTGMKVFSTPKGILSDKEAKKENLGGEILFAIW